MAEAQVNKCIIDGRHTWQTAPCPPGTAEEGSQELDDQGQAQAQGITPSEPPPRPKTKQERCTEVAGLAERVMQQRQRGASMRDLMNRVPGNNLAQLLIMAAYEEPRFSTSEYKQRKIREFENRYFLACLKEIK